VESTGALVTVEAVAPRVLRIHPVTGSRSIVSGCPANEATGQCLGTVIGQGPPLVDSTSIAVAPDGTLIVVDGCDPIFGCVPAVVRVDPRTGDRTMVSDATRGTGPALIAPLGFAVEANGHLVVIDSAARAVVRVDPRTGDRTMVSGGTSTRGVGIPFIHPSTITMEADGHFVVVDDFIGLKALIRVDPVQGDRTILSK
jgi:streptogramin lyase